MTGPLPFSLTRLQSDVLFALLAGGGAFVPSRTIAKSLHRPPGSIPAAVAALRKKLATAYRRDCYILPERCGLVLVGRPDILDALYQATRDERIEAAHADDRMDHEHQTASALLVECLTRMRSAPAWPEAAPQVRTRASTAGPHGTFHPRQSTERLRA